MLSKQRGWGGRSRGGGSGALEAAAWCHSRDRARARPAHRAGGAGCPGARPALRPPVVGRPWGEPIAMAGRQPPRRPSGGGGGSGQKRQLEEYDDEPQPVVPRRRPRPPDQPPPGALAAPPMAIAAGDMNYMHSQHGSLPRDAGADSICLGHALMINTLGQILQCLQLLCNNSWPGGGAAASGGSSSSSSGQTATAATPNTPAPWRPAPGTPWPRQHSSEMPPGWPRGGPPGPPRSTSPAYEPTAQFCSLCGSNLVRPRAQPPGERISTERMRRDHQSFREHCERYVGLGLFVSSLHGGSGPSSARVVVAVARPCQWVGSEG